MDVSREKKNSVSPFLSSSSSGEAPVGTFSGHVLLLAWVCGHGSCRTKFFVGNKKRVGRKRDTQQTQAGGGPFLPKFDGKREG